MLHGTGSTVSFHSGRMHLCLLLGQEVASSAQFWSYECDGVLAILSTGGEDAIMVAKNACLMQQRKRRERGRTKRPKAWKILSEVPSGLL